MSTSSLRRAEVRTRRILLRVRALVAAASSVAGAAAINACSTTPSEVDAYEDGGSCARELLDIDSGDDAEAGCETFFRRRCGFPPSTSPTLAGCQFNFNDCVSLCGSPAFTCFAFGDSCQADGGVVNDDTLVVQCGSCLGIAGRRPEGWVEVAAPRKWASAIGTYFARTAQLEAASVHAFRILRRELAACGAPVDLIEAARRAERDEVEHAKITTRMARIHDAKPAPLRTKRRRLRSLESLALENAVEGCVRETFGALIATWQAERATDQAVAIMMKRIAIDETRHAALAWSIAAWAETQLGAEARQRVEDAKNKAIRDLETQSAVEPHPVLVARAGLPCARDQQRLLQQLRRDLICGRPTVHAT